MVPCKSSDDEKKKKAAKKKENEACRGKLKHIIYSSVSSKVMERVERQSLSVPVH
jgi:hypothetical protein